MMSSICSGEVVSEARLVELIEGQKPRFLACLIIFLTAASDRSSNGDGASAESFSGASAALSSFPCL